MAIILVAYNIYLTINARYRLSEERLRELWFPYPFPIRSARLLGT